MKLNFLGRHCLFVAFAVALVVVFSISALAGTVKIGDTIELTDTENRISNSNGTVTVSVKAQNGLSGSTTKTNTITISNKSSSKSILYFEYSIDGKQSAFTIDDKTVSNKNSYTATLDVDATVTIVIKSTASGFLGQNTATLTLSAFSLTAVAQAAKVEIDYNSSLGTVKLDSATVESGSVVEATSDGIALVATPTTNAKFLGWVDADTHAMISSSASYELAPTNDMNIVAAFSSDSAYPWFLAGGTNIYDNWSDAMTFASAANDKTVVLLCNGTLPSGEYEVVSGVTLLIPFDDAHTLYTTAPACIDSSYVSPTVYRKLTMAEGAKITVNGALSLSAKQCAVQGSNGSPTGKISVIEMKSGSSIQVYGALYAWGVIAGSGNVSIESGAVVYEDFQLRDWRGGNATLDLVNARENYRIFPLSQFYIQNVQVPMTVHAGAREWVYMSVSVSIVGIQEAPILFIGKSTDEKCMFQLTDGTLTKDYIESEDKLYLNVTGEATLGNLELELQVTLLSKVTIYSNDYILALTPGISINVNSDSKVTIAQDIAVLPGTKVTVEENASIILGSGNKIIIYDFDDWKANYVYGDVAVKPCRYVYGRKKTISATDLTDATICINGTVDLSAGEVYTTDGGGNIFSETSGKVILGTNSATTTTYQYDQTNKKYISITANSGWLKNADGSYVKTGEEGNGAGTYYYNKDHGRWVKGEHTITSVVTAPTCTEAGYTTHTCTCGYSYTDSTVDALGHNYSEEVTSEPTCTEEGVLTFTCTACGDTKTESIDALGHDYETETVEATCTEDGSITYTCSVCGDTYAETIAALGHTEVIDAAVDATCTTSGKTEGKHCSVCNEILVAQETVDALGHDYESVVTEPTCTEAGYTTYTCSVCGDSYVADQVDALGHDYESVVTEPTCTEAGYTTYTCACGESYISDEVAATGHSYGGWVVDGDTKTSTCGGCGEIAKRLVGEMNHLYSVQDVLYYNGSFDYSKDAKEIVFRDPQGNVLDTILCVQDSSGVIYLTYAMPSNVILDVVEFVIWIDGVQTDVFEINFDSYADTQTGTNYENVAQAIVDYGNASSTYFGDVEISEITAKYTSEPESGMSIKPNATESTSLDTYGASFVFDEYIAIKIYLSGNYTFKDGCTYQVGVLFGDETTSELNVNSIGNLCKAYVLYNTLENVEISASDWVSPISAASADISKVPVLANKPGVQINLESVEYSKRFAIRAYLIECNADGNQTVYYGRQVNYGLEDYVCSMYNRTNEVLKTNYNVINPMAFKQFLIETWNYAVAAKETKWAE